jgi:DNA polymerase-3 subunit beta
VFPDYRQIIPSDLKTEAVVLKQDLLSALKLSLIFSGPFHRVDITASPKKKLLELSSESDHVGKNLVQLDASAKGEEVTTSFNLRYLVDCFQSIQQDGVSLGFSGAQKPLVVRGVGDNSFTYLVMPMNK